MHTNRLDTRGEAIERLQLSFNNRLSPIAPNAWRVHNLRDGMTLQIEYGPAGWQTTSGTPGMGKFFDETSGIRSTVATRDPDAAASLALDHLAELQAQNSWAQHFREWRIGVPVAPAVAAALERAEPKKWGGVAEFAAALGVSVDEAEDCQTVWRMASV